MQRSVGREARGAVTSPVRSVQYDPTKGAGGKSDLSPVKTDFAREPYSLSGARARLQMDGV